MRGNDHGQLETGIELAELLERHSRELGGRFGVNVARLRHRDEEGLVAHVGQLHAVLRGIGHNALDGLELGYIVGRFIGHAEMLVVGRALPRLLAANGTLHASLAPIVGGERQMPVTEHTVKIFEVVERCARALKHVAPVVAPEILLQGVVRARRRHELPEACSLGARKRLGLECAFHERQERKLRGHATILDLLKNVIEVAPRALEHAVQIVRLAAVVLEPPIDLVVLKGRHGIASTDAVPDVNRRTECLNRADRLVRSRLRNGRSLVGRRHACSRSRLRNARCGLEKQKGESETKKGQRFQQKRTNLKRSDHGAKKMGRSVSCIDN